MTRINILHFTDLHRSIGGYQDYIYPTVEEELLDSLRRLHDRTGPIDLVCFTGDLVYSGGGEDGQEFPRLDETLDRLWSEFNKLGSPNPPLLTVPGNHDLRRPATHLSTVKILTSWEQHPDVQARFWEDSESEYLETIHQALSGYTNWLTDNPFRQLDCHPGYLPGDFSTTFEKAGWKIGIVGLNSTFLQLTGGDFEGRLVLSPAQLSKLHGQGFTDWLNQHHFNLLLTHHPPGWLYADALDEYRANIAPPDRFLAHLCGHLHTDYSETRIVGGVSQTPLLQGEALFGLEYYGQSKQRKRQHGYSLLSFELDQKEPTWRRWPMQGVKHAGGQWQIVPNYRAANLQDDGSTVGQQVLLKRRPPAGSAPKAPGAEDLKSLTAPAPSDSEVLRAAHFAFEDTMAAIRQITTSIWQRLQPFAIYDDRRVDMSIEANGDTHVQEWFKVQSSQEIPFIPYEISADREHSAAVISLRDLQFKVELEGRRRASDEVIFVQTDNFEYRKRVLVFFKPGIDARARRLRISYRWPRLFGRLLAEGEESLAFDWRRPLQKARICVSFAKELGRIEGHLAGGRRRGVTLRSKRGEDERLVWTCTFNDVQAGVYQLDFQLPK